jgi:sigma-B regulation protein RsbU (phosphoserine phosphatase)
VLDSGTHMLSYCNAGHNHPFLIRGAREYLRLKTGGTVLGTFMDASYKEDVISFDPGDLLFVYSDGLAEAVNSEEQEFGETRLSEIVVANRRVPAEQLIDNIIASVRLFVGEVRQQDDMTVMVIGREA